MILVVVLWDQLLPLLYLKWHRRWLRVAFYLFLLVEIGAIVQPAIPH